MDKNIQNELAFAMTERPRCFRVGGKPFFIYPITLGMIEVMKPLIQDLSHDDELSHADELLELLRICEEDKEKVCILIAYRTCKDQHEVYDMPNIEEKVKILMDATSTQLAEILIMILKDIVCDTSEYEEFLGITKEKTLLKRTIDIKDKKASNNVSFGGVSIYGRFIGHFCKEYGWSYQYVMWGISYFNLKMLLADERVDVYLTDDERKRCPVARTGEDVVDMSSKEGADMYLHCFDNF